MTTTVIDRTISILFVDDEKRYVEIYIQELKDSGYEVELKTDVDSALQFFRDRHKDISLLILDIMMPAGEEFKDVDKDVGLRTGVLFYEKIKEMKPALPVIILTNVNKEDLAKISQTKKCLVLEKADIFPLDLVAEVENMLRWDQD